MVIYLVFILALAGGLFIVNKVSLKGNNNNQESILDQLGSMDLEAYMQARQMPLTLIRTGVFLLLFDAALLIVVVAAFDLTSSEPSWENWFAIIVMVVLPATAIFLIIRGFLKLNRLKKQYNNRI